MSTDPLSEVLHAVRLTGAVYFAVDACAPWVAEGPRAGELAPHLMPGVEHVIEYHVVTRGSCWGGVVGEPAICLDAGDVIVFPQGDAHVMSSAPGMRGEPDLHLEHALPPNHLPIAITMNGGGTDRSELICGFLGCDARPFNPMLANLPRVIHTLFLHAARNPLFQSRRLRGEGDRGNREEPAGRIHPTCGRAAHRRRGAVRTRAAVTTARPRSLPTSRLSVPSAARLLGGRLRGRDGPRPS
jgi:hypothetical protein